MGLEEPGSEGEAGLTVNLRRRRLPGWLLWTGGLLLLLLAVAVGVVAVMMRRAEPMLRTSLIATLEEKFHSRVELDELHVSAMDGFEVEGSGLRIWLPAQHSPALEGDDPWRSSPWIRVNRLGFHASWRMRPGEPIVVEVFRLEGVQVLLPPKEDRPQLSMGSGKRVQEPSALRYGMLKLPHVEIRQIACTNAELVVERQRVPDKPVKAPLIFELKHATLTPDRNGGPISYDVELVNARPVGVIRSKGSFGPWLSGDPSALADLPVEGEYHFDDVDLSTIKGIAGKLSSTGQYSGTLRRIVANGETETPDFRLERVSLGAGVPLTTRFHAEVDGTNGDTWLDPVEATLGETHFIARGQVVRVAGAAGMVGVNGPGHGHDITLKVTMDRGRIEDILNISTNRNAPFMTGNLTLENDFHLPPGEENVWDRLQLDGTFHLSQVRFANAAMQGRIEQLSLRGQGRPDEVRSTDPTSVRSEMQGHFSLAGGFLHLPDLDYTVPGAEIVAQGVYGLRTETLDFEGDARLDAPLSKIVGGWKGLLLKPADQFLRKNGAATDVPIHVKGTRREPKFGVDFDRLGKNQK